MAFALKNYGSYFYGTLFITNDPLCLGVAKREDVKEAKKLKRKEDKL